MVFHFPFFNTSGGCVLLTCPPNFNLRDFFSVWNGESVSHYPNSRGLLLEVSFIFSPCALRPIGIIVNFSTGDGSKNYISTCFLLKLCARVEARKTGTSAAESPSCRSNWSRLEEIQRPAAQSSRLHECHQSSSQQRLHPADSIRKSIGAAQPGRFFLCGRRIETKAATSDPPAASYSARFTR